MIKSTFARASKRRRPRRRGKGHVIYCGVRRDWKNSLESLESETTVRSSPVLYVIAFH